MCFRLIKSLILSIIFMLFSINSYANNSSLGTASNLPNYLQDVPAPAIPSTVITELEDFLLEYEALENDPWPAIKSDKIIRIGDSGQIIIDIKKRLIKLQDLNEINSTSTDHFDHQLKTAIKHFQQRMGIAVDGEVGPKTLQEMNVTPLERAQQIEINITRWESLVEKTNDRYILVNVPDYKLYLYEDGQKILDMKIVVGKKSRATPNITSEITHVIFNPAWNVPSMIARKDIVPKVLTHPYYLADMHMRIFSSRSRNAVEIPEDEINWKYVAQNGFPYYFRQDPGIGNALGQVKFEFENTESIYLHDTPSKYLFDQPQRAFSSGCIRLEKPLALVADLMQFNTRWNEIKMQNLLDKGNTAYVKMSLPTTVIITYLTSWVDDLGQLNFRDDIYQRDLADS